MFVSLSQHIKVMIFGWQTILKHWVIRQTILLHWLTIGVLAFSTLFLIAAEGLGIPARSLNYSVTFLSYWKKWLGNQDTNVMKLSKWDFLIGLKNEEVVQEGRQCMKESRRMPWCSKKYRLWLKEIPPLFFFLRSLFFDVIVSGGEAKNHCSCASLDK